MRQFPLATVRSAAIAGILTCASCLCGGCGTGAATKTLDAGMKAEHAAVTTASNALQVVQQTALQVHTIPQLVFDMATAILNGNNQAWGMPETVVVTDTDYVLLYPTTAAERQRNGGIPRMVMIKRNDQTDPGRGS